jgi:hypothetical protein
VPQPVLKLASLCCSGLLAMLPEHFVEALPPLCVLIAVDLYVLSILLEGSLLLYLLFVSHLRHTMLGARGSCESSLVVVGPHSCLLKSGRPELWAREHLVGVAEHLLEEREHATGLLLVEVELFGSGSGLAPKVSVIVGLSLECVLLCEPLLLC